MREQKEVYPDSVRECTMARNSRNALTTYISEPGPAFTLTVLAVLEPEITFAIVPSNCHGNYCIHSSPNSANEAQSYDNAK